MNPGLKGSLWNQKWDLKEPFVEGSLKNALRKWFFEEPLFERFLVEPEMVLLWHPFTVPCGTFIVLCVGGAPYIFDHFPLFSTG